MTKTTHSRTNDIIYFSENLLFIFFIFCSIFNKKKINKNSQYINIVEKEEILSIYIQQ